MRATVWSLLLSKAATLEEGSRLLDEAVPPCDDEAELPMPPTDDEKELYLESGRAIVVGAGLAAAATLVVGIWLFVCSTPIFYWYSLPALMITLYMSSSYCGVAILGQDFDLNEHMSIVEHISDTQEIWPTVDVFLPSCGEPLSVIINTFKYVAQLQYPADRLNVYALDDAGLGTVKAAAEHFGFTYICRTDRPNMKKAGNMKNCFTQSTGKFIAVFDADFCPRSDFLFLTLPRMIADSTVGIVQTPQFFRIHQDQNWLQRAAAATQELFYRVVQTNRCSVAGAAICVGSNAVYRRATFASHGSFAMKEASEDAFTGLQAMCAGFKVMYVPLVLCAGLCPSVPQQFFSQQQRWARGSLDLCTSKELWHSDLTWHQTLCFLSGGMYYFSTGIGLFFNSLPGILMIYQRPQLVHYYNTIFAVPCLIFPFIAMRHWSKSHYGMACVRIRILQYCAHLYSVVDMLSCKRAQWVATGVKPINTGKAKHRYHNATAWLVNWTVLQLIVTYVGVSWRMQQYGLVNFLPTLALETLNAYIALSVLYK